MKRFFILILLFFFAHTTKSQVTINTYTTWGVPGGTATYNPNGSLTVNDTLIIYGNLSLDLDEDLTISSTGVLIVFGDFSAKNKVDLGLGGYFIVTGNFDKVGSNGAITDNGGSMYIFDDTPKWGTGSDPVPQYDGGEEAIINDPIFDLFNDLVESVCTIAISNPVITNESCSGASNGAINITVTGVTSPSFLWSNGATTQNISGLPAGKYVIEIYKGYCILKDSFIVSTTLLPEAAGIISGNSPVCAGSGGTYTVPTIANATSYVWTANNGAIGTSTTNSINLVFPNPGTSTIMVHGINSCGNGASSSLEVTINSTPDASITAGNSTACAGSIGNLYSVTNNAAWTYSWSVEDDAGIIQPPGNTSIVAIDWKSNAQLFVGPYINDSSMTKKVSVTIHTNPANGCPKTLEWNVILYRVPQTGPTYHISNAYAH